MFDQLVYLSVLLKNVRGRALHKKCCETPWSGKKVIQEKHFQGPRVNLSLYKLDEGHAYLDFFVGKTCCCNLKTPFKVQESYIDYLHLSLGKD